MMLGGPKGHKAQKTVFVFMFFGYLPGRRWTIFGPLASYAGSREGNPAGNCDAHLRYSRRLLCTIILHTIPIGFVSRVASLSHLWMATVYWMYNYFTYHTYRVCKAGWPLCSGFLKTFLAIFDIFRILGSKLSLKMYQNYVLKGLVPSRGHPGDCLGHNAAKKL